MIISCKGDVTTIRTDDPRLTDLQTLQLRIQQHRFILFICWEDNHFVGMIFDNGDETRTLRPHLTYLDSLQGQAENHILCVQRFIDWIMINRQPTSGKNSWIVNPGATVDMIRQRPYRRRHERPEAAKHIECGIYVLLMIQLYLLQIPLTVLTPSKVHR